jgi:hypothetical protein
MYVLSSLTYQSRIMLTTCIASSDNLGAGMSSTNDERLTRWTTLFGFKWRYSARKCQFQRFITNISMPLYAAYGKQGLKTEASA